VIQVDLVLAAHAGDMFQLKWLPFIDPGMAEAA